jgi:citrate synthase
MAYPSIDDNEGYIDSIIAGVLGIDSKDIHDKLGYQSVPQWDSLRHVSLMLALEEAFAVEIEPDQIPVLQDVSTIREFFSPNKIRYKLQINNQEPTSKINPTHLLHRGLTNLLFDNTHISRVDGENGILEYRGYSIHDLVSRSSFEETTYLLLYGELPRPAELREFTTRLEDARAVPAFILNLMRELRHAHPTEALRTGVSVLATFNSDGADNLWHSGVRLIAQVPVLIGAHQAARQGREFVLPSPNLPFAEHFLHLLLGTPPRTSEIRLMERGLILHGDLAANPSAFAARIAISCNAGMHAAITAAIAAFAGPLHGGAAEQVLKMIDTIGEPENAEKYVAERRALNQPVMGFGHRVFRVEDPRARHFRDLAFNISRERGDMREYNVIQALVDATRPYARYGVHANVDLYAGVIYRRLGLPDDLTVSIFIAGRMVGWAAQALEQRESNILIYPLMNYIGATERTFPPRTKLLQDPAA